MMVLSVVIIAGLVGGEGLGYQVILGLSKDTGLGMVAGICILLLAVVIDRITQAMGQPVTGRAEVTGARAPKGRSFGKGRIAGAEMASTSSVGSIQRGGGET